MIRRLMSGATRLVAFLATFATIASAQVVVKLGDAGTGDGPDILQRALAAPHTVIAPQATRYVLPADSTYQGTAVSLGNTVIVEGTVHGDLIVVGGDLYMHPGGTVTGRAVAIGGGVYESALGHTGSIRAFRDFTYDFSAIPGGYSLSYRSLSTTEAVPTFHLTGVKGLQVPSYDRSNGLSLPVSASIAVPHSSIRITPTLTYRSQLGRLDPMVALASPLDEHTAVRLEAGRGTFTNEAWIWSDVVNSVEYLVAGNDARNYYRASRARATFSRNWDTETSTVESYVGAQIERGTSVRPGEAALGGPWALFHRDDRKKVLRPNPEIDPGTTTSLMGGGRGEWTGDVFQARAALNEEIGRFSSASGFTSPAGTFAQTTVDGRITFPTFGNQTLRFDVHGVFTGGDEPRQRWAYVGGPGSIPTLDLLARGGNQLVYLDARYGIPIERLTLPIVGPPTIALREVLAGASENRFPTLSQAMGVRLSAGFVYVELLIDPVNHHTYQGFGISLSR